jgi:hypothetical protein
MGYDSALPTQQRQPPPSNRKRKPRDRSAGHNAWDQCIDDVDPPSPSQCTRPRKRGRLSHRPEVQAIDAGEDDEGQINGDEEDKKRWWTDAELKEFIYALMGPDGYWEKFVKNPAGVFKRVSVVVGNAVSTCANFTLRSQKSTSPIVLMSRL